MFPRIKSFKNKDGGIRQYLYLVETKRIGGSVKQVIVGILMTKEGLPIGHEAYPGNTNDIGAFKEMIRIVKVKFKIRRVIIVCDRGMVGEDNIRTLESNGYEYVVGMRMRRLKEEDAQKILSIKNTADEPRAQRLFWVGGDLPATSDTKIDSASQPPVALKSCKKERFSQFVENKPRVSRKYG